MSRTSRPCWAAGPVAAASVGYLEWRPRILCWGATDEEAGETLPGADLLARGFDFLVSDPLHHYMDTGMLQGVQRRAEGPGPRDTSTPDRRSLPAEAAR
jgi:hypothetical protein